VPNVLDLSRNVPRSPFDTLHGFMWLPRLIDKTRAMQAGTLGDYAPYPCPGDRNFLGFFGIKADELGQLIGSGADDDTIGAWVARQAKQPPDAFNRKLVKPPANPFYQVLVWLFKTRLKKRLQQSQTVRDDCDWREVDSLAKILAVEEGHPFPS
jgi:hypothetical protein